MRLLLITIISLACFAPLIAKADLQCQWTSFQTGKSCGETLDQDWQKKEWTSYSDNNCTQPRTSLSNDQQTTVCCCHQIAKIKTVSPKYLIIGSVIIVFGIITAFLLLAKSKELN